jgi:hypothetical protein
MIVLHVHTQVRHYEKQKKQIDMNHTQRASTSACKHGNHRPGSVPLTITLGAAFPRGMGVGECVNSWHNTSCIDLADVGAS